MAQSGVLRMPRVQLIRGLARTIEKADLSADDRQTMPQVSSTVGRHSGGELIRRLTDKNLSISPLARRCKSSWGSDRFWSESSGISPNEHHVGGPAVAGSVSTRPPRPKPFRSKHSSRLALWWWGASTSSSSRITMAASSRFLRRSSRRTRRTSVADGAASVVPSSAPAAAANSVRSARGPERV